MNFMRNMDTRHPVPGNMETRTNENGSSVGHSCHTIVEIESIGYVTYITTHQLPHDLRPTRTSPRNLQMSFITKLAARRLNLLMAGATDCAYASDVLSGGSELPLASRRTGLRALRKFGLRIPLRCNSMYVIHNYNLV